MSRFSLSNRFLAINHASFLALQAHFASAVERAFGCKVCVQVEALSVPKLYTTFVDDDMQRDIDEHNSNFTLLSGAQASAITSEVWNRARYIGAIIRPAGETDALSCAFASVEYKGFLPKTATFYMQPDADSVQTEMRRAHPRMIVGEGWQSNGRRSGSVPPGIGSWWPATR